MKYKAPVDSNNKPYYIPVIAKSKDYLAGYLHAMTVFSTIFEECLKRAGVDIDMGNFDVGLDSTRFNDILPNGKRMSECSQNEIKESLEKMINEKVEKSNEQHPDNDSKVFKDSILKLECPNCGLGIYSFDKIEQIPDKQFTCSICGNVILDYTGHYDNEYEYDGRKEQK